MSLLNGFQSSIGAFVLLALLGSAACDGGYHVDDPDLFHFVSRPDLRPPIWNITIYDESKLSPGYWVLAPKRALERTIGTGAAYTGPAIYDGSGELIWSGTHQLDSPNINDFRLNELDGKQVLTMLNRDLAYGVILDNSYGIQTALDIVGTSEGAQLNGHEFNVFDDSRSVIVIRNHVLPATQRERDAIGFEGDECLATYNKFAEIDLKTGKDVFTFETLGQIGIDESTMRHDKKSVEARCQNGWDFMHANSVDKCPNGDYLFNARHTDTIYQVSKDNGTVMWRLGGTRPDFDMGNVNFSRQHDIRCRSQNDTHTIISILDNAVGEDSAPPSYAFSRGLLIALDTVNMSASLVAEYNHPDAGYAQRRGNLQILDNGNVFMGWSEGALQSEYTANGTLLMQAVFQAKWLGSYRNYKFEYTGRPLTKPDIAAAVYLDTKGDWKTQVHVSWNGDTEVRSWHLYNTTLDGDHENKIASVDRVGFESLLRWDGYSSYVTVKGLDGNGEIIGMSNVVKTAEHPRDPRKIAKMTKSDQANQQQPLPARLTPHADL